MLLLHHFWILFCGRDLPPQMYRQRKSHSQSSDGRPARELESGTAELGEVGAGSGEWAGACPGSDSCTAAAL